MGEMFFNWSMMVSMMDPFRNSKGFFIMRRSLVMSCTPVCERGVALLMKSNHNRYDFPQAKLSALLLGFAARSVKVAVATGVQSIGRSHRLSRRGLLS